MQADTDQPRTLAAELGQIESEADLVETVGLQDDLPGCDVLIDYVYEFLEAVTLGAKRRQLQVVGATRLGFDDEVEHHVMRHLGGGLRCYGGVERGHVRGDAHRR